MQTSAQGIAALELEEGVVLRAYRDSVGVWTIGAGLTPASGVVKPRAGMVISKDEATALLAAALRGKYEPAVEKAMSAVSGDTVTRPLQHEFDAGLSFHWNLGAIERASWVAAWKKKSPRYEIRNRMMMWNKAGGKVLPGLTARREREAAMLLDGVYRRIPADPNPPYTFAKWGLSLSGAEITAVREGLRRLGYAPGNVANAVEIMAARKFQSDHGLTVDGVIGRATLSTLQRALDARAKAKAPVAASFIGATAASTDLTDQIASLPWAGSAVGVVICLWALNVAFRYRDIIAAEINSITPRAAAFLRSF
jgi:lysozyme